MILFASFVVLLASAQAVPDDLQHILVEGHNECRQTVGVGPVGHWKGIKAGFQTWDDDLAAFAQTTADGLKAKGCSLEHRSDADLQNIPNYIGKQAGENLAQGFDSWWTVIDMPAMIHQGMSGWCGEKQWYDIATDSCSAPAGESCGHYTQVVWDTSTKIGCGIAICGQSEYVLACNYQEGGNCGMAPYGRPAGVSCSSGGGSSGSTGGSSSDDCTAGTVVEGNKKITTECSPGCKAVTTETTNSDGTISFGWQGFGSCDPPSW